MDKQIVEMVDRVIEKAFKSGFEAAFMEIFKKYHTSEQLSLAYYREQLAEAAWKRVKNKFT